MSTSTPRSNLPQLYSVELRTAQWPAVLRWYRDVLGLRSLVRVVEDGFALLGAGTVRIALLSREQPGPASERLSLAFEVDDLDSLVVRLARAGTRATAPQLTSEGYRVVSTSDPDGNQIRIFAWPRR